jgi:Pvc16 N-terminal domain
MSNYLAIATVTAALRQLITDAVTADVPGADVKVSHVRPGGDAPKTPGTGVNIFLYAVTPNAALRNDDIPTRRSDGQVVKRPQAALDLHYLFTFYGDDGLLETQRLLGSVVRTLHAAPTIPRKKLAEVTLGQAVLSNSDLGAAEQAVRLTPVHLSLEELSKLWSVLFQTPYALSAAYQASLVLIEGTDALRPTLPVRRRAVHAVPFARPVIERVVSDAGPAEPIVPTTTIAIEGQDLRGDVTRVRAGTQGDELIPREARARRVTLPLSDIPASKLRAGVQGVQVVHQRLLGEPPVPHRGEESNVAPFVLRPVIDKKTADPTDPEHAIVFAAGPPAKVSVTVTPTVGKAQRAVLLLNQLASATPAAHSFEVPPRTADLKTIDFPVPGVAAGTYLVRVQVDGAESPLVEDAAGAPVRPRVVIP